MVGVERVAGAEGVAHGAATDVVALVGEGPCVHVEERVLRMFVDGHCLALSLSSQSQVNTPTNKDTHNHSPSYPTHIYTPTTTRTAQQLQQFVRADVVVAALHVHRRHVQPLSTTVACTPTRGRFALRLGGRRLPKRGHTPFFRVAVEGGEPLELLGEGGDFGECGVQA